jgi:ABC-type sugar transport system ATPase subunit
LPTSLVRRLAERGVAVIYVSHRMKEIPRVADSVTVLRDGRHAGTLEIADATTDRVIELMTGGSIGEAGHRSGTARGRPVLEIRNLTSTGRLEDVSFDLHAGEIVGIAGLLGSGRTELLRCIYGVDRADAGTVSIVGFPGGRRSPRQMIRNGVGFTPESRKREGLALGLSVADNLVMSAYDHLARGSWINRARERRLARSSMTSLDVKAASEHVAVGLLSGGNQQKVVLGKCLNARARILLMDEPTRGVDIDAKRQLYALMRRLAEQGKALVFVSSEIEELLVACDRVLVLHHGRLVADTAAAAISLDRLMALVMEGASS